MSRLDDDMIDPEFADLAVLVYAERPEPDPEFVRELDARVERRFASASGRGATGTGGRRSRFHLTWKAGAGSLAAGLAAAVLVVVIGSGGGERAHSPLLSVSTATQATTAGTASGAASTQAFDAGSPGAGGSGESAPGTFSRPAAGAAAKAPSPLDNGRKIVQSAQLALTTAPSKVEDVAQQVFDVVGRANGVVRRSSVTQTGGLDGSATFDLSVPSGSLSDTMTALSRLHGANVASRTDLSTDVNDRYVSLTRQLADARALRTGLLRQLAQATTQTEIDSLRARIRDVESSITSLEARLKSLNRAVSMSRISLTIDAAATPTSHSGGGSSFTLGTAAHDAGRVLTVAAGVALIGLAVMVPVALVGALILWVAATVRHRRRERALDLA